MPQGAGQIKAIAAAGAGFPSGLCHAPAPQRKWHRGKEAGRDQGPRRRLGNRAEIEGKAVGRALDAECAAAAIREAGRVDVELVCVEPGD